MIKGKYLMHRRHVQKAMWFVEKCPGEIGGLGKSKFIGTHKIEGGHEAVWCSESLDLLQQTVGAADVNLEPLATSNWFDEKLGEEWRSSRPNLLFWHSHVRMMVFMSSTDTATVDRLVMSRGYVISVVFNKKWDVHCQVDWIDENDTKYTLQCELEIYGDAYNGKELEDQQMTWKKEYDELVLHRPAWSYKFQGQGTGRVAQPHYGSYVLGAKETQGKEKEEQGEKTQIERCKEVITALDKRFLITKMVRAGMPVPITVQINKGTKPGVVSNEESRICQQCKEIWLYSAEGVKKGFCIECLTSNINKYIAAKTKKEEGRELTN